MLETSPNYVIDDSEEIHEAAHTLMAMRCEYFSKKEAIYHQVSSTPSSSSSQQVSLPDQEPFPQKRSKTKEKQHKTQLTKVKSNYTKRKHVEQDNTEETLSLVKAWNEHKIDPKEKIEVLANVAEWFSEPAGLDVLVYGSDGKTHEKMNFKMWDVDTPVLTCGWNDFVQKNSLEAYCDFLTIWMFRHVETHKICFAIHKERLPINSPLSKSTLKEIS
ncbi:unnamed protein product [Cochlearia groenlandica]